MAETRRVLISGGWADGRVVVVSEGVKSLRFPPLEDGMELAYEDSGEVARAEGMDEEIAVWRLVRPTED
jgi:hypothetical protein